MDNKNLPPKSEKLLPSHLEKKVPLPPIVPPPTPPPPKPPISSQSPSFPPPANPSIASVGLPSKPKKSFSLGKKAWLIILLVFLALASIAGGIYLIKQRTEVKPKAADNQEDCEAEGHTWCGSGSCPDGWSYGPGCWTGGSCAARDEEACQGHQGGGGGGGEGENNGITENCVCGGWHEGWCDANACADHPNDCCGGDCMTGLVKCSTLGRCQRPDEICPGGTNCNPSSDCQFSCDGKHANASCNSNCPSPNIQSYDICRGKKTNGNCQKCKGCEVNNPPGCDLSCDCSNANQSTCYEGKSDSGPFDCRNTQQDVLIDNQYVFNCTWEDGRTWEECIPTLIPPTSTPVPTNTPAPSYSCECSDIKLYNQNWDEIQPTNIIAGQTIYIAVAGSKAYPQYEFDKGRIRINESAWEPSHETTNRVPQKDNEFYITYTIPPEGGRLVIEGEIHLNATIPDPQETDWWR